MSTEAMRLLARMDTTTVSDALDRLGIQGQCLGIKPLDRTFRLAGPAYTIRYVPCGTQGGTVGDYIDDLPEGTVVALDNQGRMDATVWGDILTTVAHRRKLGGPSSTAYAGTLPGRSSFHIRFSRAAATCARARTASQ